jgi:4-hydroxy-4-methyl-2-oxoglutarate aldolase
MTKITKTTLFLLAVASAWGQGRSGGQGGSPPPSSHQYLKVQQYTAEEDARIVKLYDGLRVADVIDGLDAVGLPEVTMMDKHIRPLWRDEQKITHRIHGIALTVRLVPAQATSPKFASHAEERKWEAGGWEPPAEIRAEGGKGPGYMGLIRPGTILVVDGEAHDNGMCGSNNALTMTGRGLRGLVGNAVCRDTDELTLTRIPVYQDPMEAPRGINQGRMWVESYNEPIVVGGVLVMPGDIIVADNDGVAVVPRRQAEQVAEISRWIFEDDEMKRGKIYDSIGRPRDWTVQGHTDPAPATAKPIKQ